MPTVAVIGCGDVSSVHFEALASTPDTQLVAVCDTDPRRLHAASERHGVQAFSDYRTMLDTVHPGVVHICTPHHLHASMTVDCLDRGIHVLVEKPLAHTRAEGARVVAAAQRSSARIAVCFQNRYNTTVEAMRGLLDGGELGAILGASATVMWSRTPEYYRNRPWRGTWAEGGGGLMMNQAIHTVDLLQWLVGDIVSVDGRTSTRRLADVIAVEDTAEFVAEHTGGIRSVFFATLANATNAPVTLDIETEKASLHLGDDLTVTYRDGKREVVSDRAPAADGRTYWGASHQLLIRDFYDRLDDAEPFWIGADEAEKSLRIVKDLYRMSYPDALGEVS
ncbi:Gfo/Idh/MocA family oxidoreductase [Rhodococcus hoagii]|nr:Gfo/Idh/MocA family oxidoreductase [Prescottella equi]